MTNDSATIVQRLWNYCNVLRDDGVSYGDYVEQLTYLLFLKMDHENVTVLGKDSALPEAYNWASLRELSGAELESHYREMLTELGQGAGLIPTIFRKAQNRIQDPAKLKRLIALIDEETWMGLDIDIKGEIYEVLLQKNAEDTKSGARKTCRIRMCWLKKLSPACSRCCCSSRTSRKNWGRSKRRDKRYGWGSNAQGATHFYHR